MGDNRRFQTEEHVREWAFSLVRAGGYRLKDLKQGVYIDSKLRREILTGPTSGKIVLNGRVCQFEFASIGGGVWNVTVDIDPPVFSEGK